MHDLCITQMRANAAGGALLFHLSQLHGLHLILHFLYRVTNYFFMAVCFWYLVKSDLSCVRVYSRVHWTSQYLQGARKHGHVYLHMNMFI